MKKIIRSTHLVLGLLSGSVIFIVAITGCIVAFDDELRELFNPKLYKVESNGNERLTIDAIKTIALSQNLNEEVKFILVKKDPKTSVEVQFANREIIFINPYSGKVLGQLNRSKDFFGQALKLHRELYLEETGKWITSISALIFSIMIVSGLVLWWPSNKRNRKEKFVLKRKVHWYKLNYDLHNVLGFYASWMILLTVLTALILSFEWAENSLFFITNSKKEKRFEIGSNGLKTATAISLNDLYHQSQDYFPNSEEVFIQLPRDEKGSIRIMHRYGKNGFYKKQDNLFFDQYSGKLLLNKPFSSFSSGMKIRISVENIHTGSSFGLIGRWIVFFASLICASMPITGFLIWRNRRRITKLSAAIS